MEKENDLSISRQMVFFLISWKDTGTINFRKRLRALNGENQGQEELIGEIRLLLDKDSLIKWWDNSIDILYLILYSGMEFINRSKKTRYSNQKRWSREYKAWNVWSRGEAKHGAQGHEQWRKNGILVILWKLLEMVTGWTGACTTDDEPNNWKPKARPVNWLHDEPQLEYDRCDQTSISAGVRTKRGQSCRRCIGFRSQKFPQKCS